LSSAQEDLVPEHCIVSRGAAAVARLAELGLTADVLGLSVEAGDSKRRQKVSPQFPRNYASIVAWAETLAELRQLLIRLQVGWQINNFANYETVYLPEKRVSIAVAGGSRATGREDLGQLRLARKRGPMTTDRVKKNAADGQLAFDLGKKFDPPTKARKHEPADAGCLTWFLVIYADTDEVRLELALPFRVGSDGFVSGWIERVLLPPLPISGAVLPVDPTQDDDDDNPLVTRN
jgi:hypothetical protein